MAKFHNGHEGIRLNPRVVVIILDAVWKQALANAKPKRSRDRLQATNLSNKGFWNPPELRENLE